MKKVHKLRNKKKFQLEKEKFQLEKGKYFQSELINWEMPEEQEDKNKRIRPRERAHGQKKVLAYKGTAECLVCS